MFAFHKDMKGFFVDTCDLDSMTFYVNELVKLQSKRFQSLFLASIYKEDFLKSTIMSLLSLHLNLKGSTTAW